MSVLRLAARLARREVLRRPGRTALVALLVALPVAGMVVALVMFRTDHLTSDEQWQRDYGEADAALHLSRIGAPGNGFDPAALPAGSRAVEVETAWLRVRTDDGRRSDLSVRDYDTTDPVVDGKIDLLAGRAPAADHEVALTPQVADDLGVGIGDRLTLTRPDLALDVVGLAEDPGYLNDPAALVAPGGALLDVDPASSGILHLVDLPPGAPLDEVRGLDPSVMLRADAGDHWVGRVSVRRQVPWTFVIGSVVLTVVGIVVAAAFAAGARRQLVTLGQLSASGAPGPLLRAVLVLQGAFTGLVGAAVGVAVAASLLGTLQPRLERLLGRRFGHYDVSLAEVAGAVVIGVVAATVAALVPAWSVARVPTLTALAGRRPIPPVSHRTTAAGALAAAMGLGLLALAVLGSATGEDGQIWALVAIVGGVIELLGACAMAPAVVARLEPLAGRTRGAWRLAARSLARQRGRTGAIVSAVAAAVGLAVGATALVSGAAVGDARVPELSDRVVVVSDRTWAGPATNTEMPAGPTTATTAVGPMADGLPVEAAGPPGRAVMDDLSQVLPGSRTVTVRTAGDQADWLDLQVPVIADEDVLDAFEVEPEVRRKIDEEGIVTLEPGRSLGEVTLPDGTRDALATAESRRSLGPNWHALVSPARAEELGLAARDAGLAYHLAEPLTAGQIGDLDDLRYDWQADGGAAQYLDLSLRWPDQGPTPVQIELVLTGVALLFAVMVVGTSLALAASESREERDVLTVAGAASGTLARSAGAKAWLLAGIGAAMALPVGLLPVAVYVAADDGTMQFVVPWRAIGLLALALPVVVAVVALAASAAAQRLRPVTVSTALFD